MKHLGKNIFITLAVIALTACTTNKENLVKLKYERLKGAFDVIENTLTNLSWKENEMKPNRKNWYGLYDFNNIFDLYAIYSSS